MSDYYQYKFQFQLSPEAPAELRQVLQLLSEGHAPSPDEMQTFPPMVAICLTSGGPGDGVHSVENGLLTMTRTFHDDEFFNGAEYFVWWILQFAGYDGPVGTIQQTNGLDMPQVMVKQGDLLVTAALGLDSGMALEPAIEPGSGDAGPVRLVSQHVRSISQTLSELSIFESGYDYE